MYLLGRPEFVDAVRTLFLSGLLLLNGPASVQNPSAQTPAPTSQRPARHDSIVVAANLSPEEVEEGKLNDAYESVAQLQRKGACSTEIIQRYESEVIPRAEKSTFKVPKNRGSVAFGTFVPQTATNLSTSTAANLNAVTRFEGTDTTTNTLVNSTFTPSSPTPSNSGAITGNSRYWNSAVLQSVGTPAGAYTTVPATGRGTGTTNALPNGIDGATSFVYYVINANTFMLIGTTTSGAGATTPVYDDLPSSIE